MSDSVSSKMSGLRALPSIDLLLQTETAKTCRNLVGAQRLKTIARRVTEEMRSEIQAETLRPDDEARRHSRDALLAEAVNKLELACRKEAKRGIARVVNATGVILHTNLGRAALSDAAVKAIEEAAGFCTLEYDLTTGARGRRGPRAEELLIELTGAENALVVNNCAAASLLILTVLGASGETIVSRGELVEIGGDFRIPDVMSNSGTTLVEVGTTNRTRLDDYRRAINERTRLIMRVHQSNYRIVGFTASPSLGELAALAHEAGLLLYEDAGSGVLFDLSDYGVTGEPVIRNSISSGADVVSFSGDKLLGACQAGLIVGRHQIVERLRRHSLYRALRADKLRLAALEATLDAHLREQAVRELPALTMLSLTKPDLEKRARDFLAKLTALIEDPLLVIELVDAASAVGGGSAPDADLATTAVAVTHKSMSTNDIESRLRHATPPIIARISDAKVLIDLRTVLPQEEVHLLGTLKTLGNNP